MSIDEQLGEDINAMADSLFCAPDFVLRNYIGWLERGRPGLRAEDAAEERANSAHMPASEQLLPPMAVDATDYSKVEIRGHMHDIPIIGTIDSATGAITHTAPLPEPPAPPAEYAAGRMSFRAWLVGALAVAAAVAIATVAVMVERARGRLEE